MVKKENMEGHGLEQVFSDLQNVKFGNKDEAEAQKLKRLFLTFKTKYQKALKELAEREQLYCASQQARRLEELQEENQALVKQQKALKEMLKKPEGRTLEPDGLQTAILKLEKRNQKLGQALLEKDRAIADLRHYELGFKKLSDENRKLEHLLNSGGNGERQALLDQVQELKLQVERLSIDYRQMAEQCEQKQSQAECLTGKEAQLQNDLHEEKSANAKLKADLDQMKENMVRGLREARALKQYYQNLINEKTSVLEKNTQILRQMEELRAEIKRKDLALDASLKEKAAAKSEKEEIEQLLEQEKRGEAERVENQNGLAKQIQIIRRELEKHQRKSEEKEQEALQARQHLAKKVREASLLSEKIEEKRRTEERLQEEILDYKMKLSESQSLLQKEKDHAEHAAQQMEAVEKKYFRTHEKLQKTEAKVESLLKVEEKHQQMQQLLANLGSVIGQPVGLAQAAAALQEEQKVSAKPQPLKKRESSPLKSAPTQHDLFECADVPPSYKKDLFE